MFYVLSRAWAKEKILSPHVSSWRIRIFFFFPRSWRDENIFLYFFTELRTYHLSYSINKRDAINVADPSSMQDACHVDFVIDLAHRRVSFAQW